MNGVAIDVDTPPARRAVQRLAPLLCCLAGLAGCSSDQAGGKNSQVVAVVNDKEITVAQLNRLLRTAGATEVTPELTKQALDSLTGEELLVQAALEHKIDREPAFVQALEHSRRQLLTQFFAERAVYPKSTITADEISEYYKSEPLLFSNRRKFLLTTFLAEKSDITPAVDMELNDVASVEQVRGILDRHAIKYVTQVASVAPEQVPMAQLAKFSQAKVGDLFIHEQDGGKMLLMSVTSIEDDVPLTLERAKPMIEGYLRNMRNKKATEEYLRHAKAAAKVTYLLPKDKPVPVATNDRPASFGAAVPKSYGAVAAGEVQ